MQEFKRDFSFSLKHQSEDKIQVSGLMQDKYHDLKVNVTVSLPELIITEITAKFDKSPTPNCPLIQTRLEKLVGVVVGKGLTKAIFNTLGGSEGCINIRNMLLTSLPLVLNIYATIGSENDAEALAKNQELLAGTCVGYCDK